MREINKIKKYNDKEYYRAYLIKSEECRRREFIQEYREYISNWKEEYYFGDIEGYIHEHIEHFDVF